MEEIIRLKLVSVTLDFIDRDTNKPIKSKPTIIEGISNEDTLELLKIINKNDRNTN
jgi:hypothetical protein